MGDRSLSSEVASALVPVARAHGWDPLAIYAVMSLETGRTFATDAGIGRWSPENTAIGLIQWTEGTARRYVERTSEAPTVELQKYPGSWATWTIAKMSAGEQVTLAERFFEHASERRALKRPVDYYLATWGAAPGLHDRTVLAVKGERKYDANHALDVNGDGKIEVRDLRVLVEGRMLEIGKLPELRAEPAPVSLSFFDVVCSLGFAVLRARRGIFF